MYNCMHTVCIYIKIEHERSGDKDGNGIAEREKTTGHQKGPDSEF